MAGIPLLSSCLLVAGLAAPQEQETKKPDEAKKLPCRVHGIVVDPHGKPVAGVGIVMGEVKKLQTMTALNAPTFRGDAAGKVEFKFPAPKKDEKTYVTMLLAAPGRLAYSRTLSYPKDAAKPEIDLGEMVLERGVLLQGRVRGEDGRPIAGARVTATDSMGRSLFTRYGNTDPQLRYLVSRATSDDRGAFLLPGVHAAAMQLSIAADGYENRTLPAVSIREPLDVTLRKTGFVTGKVVDDKGQPVAEAYVRVSYEVDPASSSEKTEKDGVFNISLRHRHRYRVYTYVSGERARQFKRTHSEVFDGPKKDLVLELERVAEANPDGTGGTLLLRVTDAATGGVVEKFKAAALWMNIQWRTQERYIQSRFRQLAKEAKMPGELQLSGPKENEPQTGLVIVEAEGYAQLRIDEVNWSEEETVKVDAKLIKESVVAGVVVDEKTKKPVAGARVFAVRDDSGGQMQRIFYGYASPDSSNAVTTDEKGAFRLRGLGKGSYKVHVAKANRPAPKPLKIELKQAEHRQGLSLSMPQGTRLVGKIVGTSPQPGWRVKMVPRRDLNQGQGRVFYSYSRYSRTPGPTETLDKDGAFEFKSLAKGAYDLKLLIPRGPRGGPAVEIFIDPLRIRARDIQRDFDATEDRPGKIKGKLTLSGAPIPRDRLVVVATDFSGSRYYPSGYMGSSLMGARSMLKPDGSFELLVNKGVHMLKVVDLLTGIIMVKPEANIEVEPGQTITKNLELTAAAVRIKLKPEKEGGPTVASHLEILVQHPQPKAMGVFFFGGSSNSSGVGVSLADGKRDINLFLPLLETKLVVRTNTQRLHKAPSGSSPTLAEHEFTPEAGKTNKVELLVAAPPEITDPDPEEADADKTNAVDGLRAAALGKALEAAKVKAQKKEPAKKAVQKKETKKKDSEKKTAATKKEPTKEQKR